MRGPRGLAVLLAVASACSNTAGSLSGPSGGERYQTSGTVLEDRSHGPEICFVVQTSHPPRCGGVPIADWDWDAVSDETRASGVTWGEYRLVGTYDGETFTLTEPPADPRPDPDETEFLTPPCPEPDGGWRAQDPSRTTEATLGRVLAAAAAAPDAAGTWLWTIELTADGLQLPENVVVVAAYTGDTDRREQELRAIWGGALCVTAFEHTEQKLRGIQNDVTHDAGDLGIEMVSVSIDVSANAVVLEAVLVTPEQQAELDRRYGEGTVIGKSRLERL